MFLTATVAAGALLVAYKLLVHRAPTVVGSTNSEFTPRRKAVMRRQLPPARTHKQHLRPAADRRVAWPTYGYDEERLRAAPWSGLRPPFRRLWTFHGRALLEFPPAVGYGQVYLPTFTGRIVALDAATGKTTWQHVSGRCGWSSPAVSAQLVFVTFIGSSDCGSRARDGEVVAFDARSGRIRWRRVIGPTESSPLVARNTVYVGDWNGRIWALAMRTGRTRWTSTASGAIKGSFALAGRRLYIGDYAGAVYCIDAHNGRRIWRSGGHGSFYSSPAIAYGRVFIGSLDHGVYAFGAGTGHLLWSRPTGGYVYASPAVSEKLVLVGSYDSDFYALDAGSGLVRWRFHANGRISGAASIISGLVYFSTFSETTYALRVSNGVMVRTWPDGKYSPAVADAKHLYLVGQGRLYALAPMRRQQSR